MSEDRTRDDSVSIMMVDNETTAAAWARRSTRAHTFPRPRCTS